MYIRKPFDEKAAEADSAEGRRAIHRRHLIYYLRVWDLDADKVIGHVVDITTEGVMLISEQPIEVDKGYRLEIRWSDASGEAKKVGFLAESRWCKRDVNTSFYDTGFHIEEGGGEAFVPIQDMIDQFGFDN